MSRSYKKNPYTKDGGDKKARKQLANRSVRRRLKSDKKKDTPARLQHKKMTESWDITDYKERMSYEEAIIWYHDKTLRKAKDFYKRYPTLEAWLKYWEKCYRRK